jgi:3D (Asp-Asp-Asp) domain-containing protein
MDSKERTEDKGIRVLLRLNLYILAGVMAFLVTTGGLVLAQKTVQLEVDGDQRTIGTLVRTEQATLEELIDYEVQRQYMAELPAGSSRVAQEGKPGVERQYWQITFLNEVEVSRQLVDREVLEEPVAQVLAYGAATTVSRSGENLRYTRSASMRASAYTHTGNRTATGVLPYYGVVSVDPSVIPLGAKMYVEGYGYATALDKGKAIKGDRIDLFFNTRKEALDWGLRRVTVYFIE